MLLSGAPDTYSIVLAGTDDRWLARPSPQWSLLQLLRRNGKWSFTYNHISVGERPPIRTKERNKGENVVFIFVHCPFQGFSIKSVNCGVLYSIIIIFQNRTVNTLGRHVKLSQVVLFPWCHYLESNPVLSVIFLYLPSSGNLKEPDRYSLFFSLLCISDIFLLNKVWLNVFMLLDSQNELWRTREK